MKLLLLLLFVSSNVYHIQVSGSTQLSCKVTHKATRQESYILFNCDYRCDHAVATIDAAEPHENIMCRSDAQPTPPTNGENVD